MSRSTVGVAIALALCAVLQLPSIAAATEKNAQCSDTAEKKAKRSMFGGILSGVAGTVFSQVGGTAGAIASYALPAASLLSDELLKLLDCKEQRTSEIFRSSIIAWQVIG